MNPIIQKRAQTPNEWAFFAVIGNLDLLRYITNYYARNIGDFIISGRKCPFGPNFGLASTYLRAEIRRAARANSISYFNWLLNKFLASFNAYRNHICDFGFCGIKYSKNTDFCINIIEKCFSGIETRTLFSEYLLLDRIIVKFIYDENVPALEKLGNHCQQLIWSKAQFLGNEDTIEKLSKIIHIEHKLGRSSNIGMNFMKWYLSKYPNNPANYTFKLNAHRKNISPEEYKYAHDNDHSLCDQKSSILTSIKRGNLKILQYLYENCNKVIEPLMFRVAARHGQVPILKWLNSKVSSGSIIAMEEAIRSGRYETIDYVVATGNVVRPHLMSIAAHSGNLKLLKHLEKYCPKYTISCAHSLIQSGHLNVLCHLYKTGRVQITQQHLKKATKCGYLKIVKWIAKVVGITPYRQIMDLARDHSHTRICLWLHKKYKFKLDTRDVANACNRADIKFVDRIMKINPDLLLVAFAGPSNGMLLQARSIYIHILEKHWCNPKMSKRVINSLRKHKIYICEINPSIKDIPYDALWLLLPEF